MSVLSPVNFAVVSGQAGSLGKVFATLVALMRLLGILRINDANGGPKTCNLHSFLLEMRNALRVHQGRGVAVHFLEVLSKVARPLIGGSAVLTRVQRIGPFQVDLFVVTEDGARLGVAFAADFTHSSSVLVQGDDIYKNASLLFFGQGIRGEIVWMQFQHVSIFAVLSGECDPANWAHFLAFAAQLMRVFQVPPSGAHGGENSPAKHTTGTAISQLFNVLIVGMDGQFGACKFSQNGAS